MRVYLVDLGSDIGKSVHPVVVFSEDIEPKSDLFAEYRQVREKLLAKAPLEHKVNLRWMLFIAEAEPDTAVDTQRIFYWEYARNQQQIPYYFYLDLASSWYNAHTATDRNVLDPEPQAWLNALLEHERTLAEERWWKVELEHGIGDPEGGSTFEVTGV